MKRLLNLAVGQLHFKRNDMWYTQQDVLAMGASLADKVANLWKKEFEPVLRKEIPKNLQANWRSKWHGICPECRKTVTYR